MARGRKKGGIQINSLSDRDELTNMIINQINSLNKKIKKFNEKGITEHSNYVKNLITEDMGQFLDSGTLSKSKKFYSEKNNIWLKKTLSALHKINNHWAYGTERKYNLELTKSLEKVTDYVEKFLRKKGYSESFISSVSTNKNFLAVLLDTFGKEAESFGSDQVIEKVALNYESSGMSEDEKNKVLNNIEYSQNTQNRIREEGELLNELRNLRNAKKR